MSTNCVNKNVSGSCVNKLCQQLVPTTRVSELCQQTMSTNSVNNTCQWIVSTNYVNKLCQHNVSVICVNKLCQQTASTTVRSPSARIPHDSSRMNKKLGWCYTCTRTFTLKDKFARAPSLTWRSRIPAQRPTAGHGLSVCINIEGIHKLALKDHALWLRTDPTLHETISYTKSKKALQHISMTKLARWR